MRGDKRKRPEGDSGLSLAEMVVALGVVAVLLISTGAVFVGASKAYQKSAAASSAEQIAKGRLDRLQALAWNQTGFYNDDPHVAAEFGGEPTVILGASAPSPRGTAPRPRDTITLHRTVYNVRTDIAWTLAEGQSTPPAYDTKRLTVTLTWTTRGEVNTRVATQYRAPTPTELKPPINSTTTTTTTTTTAPTGGSALTPPPSGDGSTGGGSVPLSSCPATTYGCFYDITSDPSAMILSSSKLTTAPIKFSAKYVQGTSPQTVFYMYHYTSSGSRKYPGSQTYTPTSATTGVFTTTVPEGAALYTKGGGSPYGEIPLVVGMGATRGADDVTGVALLDTSPPIEPTEGVTVTASTSYDSATPPNTNVLCVDQKTLQTKRTTSIDVKISGVSPTDAAASTAKSNGTGISIGNTGLASSARYGAGSWQFDNIAVFTIGPGQKIQNQKTSLVQFNVRTVRTEDGQKATLSFTIPVSFAC